MSVFKLIVDLSDVSNPDEPLSIEDYSDPSGAQISLILYLFSVEPAFYHEICNASLEHDITKLIMLGPTARALSEILTASERNRLDVIPTGYSLTVYAGTAISQECIEMYKSMQNQIKESFGDHDGQVDKEFECFDLPGFTSTTEQFKIAFEKSLQAFNLVSKFEGGATM